MFDKELPQSPQHDDHGVILQPDRFRYRDITDPALSSILYTPTFFNSTHEEDIGL
jgi:hypothetical protein